jgi:Coenzyme PQQ synthesis protein D (PqqD)
MKLKKNIATSEEGFVFNPSTGDSFTTNPVANDVINLLKEEKAEKEIIKIICERYDVEESQFEKDLDDFKSQLKDYSILD